MGFEIPFRSFVAETILNNYDTYDFSNLYPIDCAVPSANA